MSAECHTHGCDIVYPSGTWPVGVCPECEHEKEIEELRARAAGLQEALEEAERGMRAILAKEPRGSAASRIAGTWLDRNRAVLEKARV